MEVNNEMKISARRILKNGAIFLGIVFALFISFSGIMVIFPIVTYIGTLLVFKIIEYFTQIKIEKKYIKKSAIILSLYAIMILIWFYALAFTYDKLEDENIKIIFSIVSIIIWILFVINTVIGIQNLVKIIRIYYKEIKERKMNNK